MSHGYLYIVTHPNIAGFCKIGVTNNPRRRLHGYQTGCPHRAFRFHTIRAVPDIWIAEYLAQGLLRGCRVSNTEWFRIHADDASELLSIIGLAAAHDGRGLRSDDGTPAREVRSPFTGGDNT